MIEWNPGSTLESIEKDVILQALKFYRGNKTATASALQMGIRTLDTKLEKYEQDGVISERAEERYRKFREDRLKEQRGQPSSLSAEAGLRMEPAGELAKEPKVPVSERPEIQEVLSKHASQGSTKRTR